MSPKFQSSRAIRAGAYLLLAFPLVVIAYQGFPVPFVSLPPIIRAAAIAGILAYSTNVLLRREGRSIAEYRISLSRLSLKHLLVGFAAGFVLFCIGAVSLRAALPFQWSFN